MSDGDARMASDRRPKIVDFSTFLSGPVASSLLRDMGADVLKVENPRSGDGLRSSQPTIHGQGHVHVGVNGGARSLAISSRSPHWEEVVGACTRWADAVIVGNRPTEARKRHLDFASLKQHSPNVIYCSISGYGDAGPWSAWPAHGQNPDAMAGSLPIEWVDGMPLTPEGWKTSGTVLAGVMAALGIMAALYRRSLGGPGEYVTTSLWSAAMWWGWRDHNREANGLAPSGRYGAAGSRYAMYPTKDDRAVLICPIEQHFWQRLCSAFGLPAETADRGTWSQTHVDYGYEDERAVIAAVTRQRTLEEWIPALTAAEIPFAPVLTRSEAMQSEHAIASHLMRSVSVAGQDAQVMRSPVRLAKDDAQDPAAVVQRSTPGIGEHTNDVLKELGLGHLTADAIKH
jgi:crotonobetainyl-CoA:carnitine CoA-transferase CaiB-like acyl-CoA transferase